MKYEVDTKFVFSGRFIVDAENAVEAKQLVHKNCGLIIGQNIECHLREDESDWEFNHRSEIITGVIRRLK